MANIRSHAISLTDFLRLGKGHTRFESFEEARQFYVDYQVLVAGAGIYSCGGVLLSALRGFFRPTDCTSQSFSELVCFDGVSASGLRTIKDLGLRPTVDIRPQLFLSYLPKRARLGFASKLALVVDKPRVFFQLLFDAYALAAESILDRNPTCERIIAANERSLGCAPFLAAAKFQLGRVVTVVQHGNPVGDFLPTLSDEYLCRSDRWFNYLKVNSIVPDIRRISDFPALDAVRYDSQSRCAVLVLHNVGYLEPNIDYEELSISIRRACERAGWTLHALCHPANNVTYGLPKVNRERAFHAGLAIGYRSTATDQLPQEMPRVSLLDYWPDFFLQQGSRDQLDDYLLRIKGVLT